jgi:hypothetical protein
MYACKKVVAAYFGVLLNKKKKDVFDRKEKVRTPPGRPGKGAAGNRCLCKPQTGITALIYLIINKNKVQIRGCPGFLLIK